MRTVSERLKDLLARRNIRRAQANVTKEDLKLEFARGTAIQAMLQTEGWKIFEEEVHRLRDLETTVLLSAAPDRLMSVDAVALQQSVRGMNRALGVVEDLVARGADAAKRLAEGKFRG